MGQSSSSSKINTSNTSSKRSSSANVMRGLVNKAMNPTPSHTLNKLRFSKGRAHISYSDRERIIDPWPSVSWSKTQYTAGDLVYIQTSSSVDPYYAFETIKFWSMCMKNHKPSAQSKPNQHSTFSDLLLEIIPALESHLVPQMAQIVIDYAYLPNDFWWNGCCSILRKSNAGAQKHFKIDNKFVSESCGKLVCLESTYQCKECYYCMKHENSTENRQFGATIRLEKEQITRQFGNKTVYDKLNGVILKKGIQSDYQKKQIRNLLWRNFNDSMAALIEALLETNPAKHAFLRKFKIPNLDKDNIHVWSLYDNSKTEVLCALIWRYVSGELDGCYTNYSQKGDTCVMFEVLFLATSEHVRHQKIGNEMVKRIEVFARLNCYDIISVAAVPEQGISFWTQNLFQMFVEQNSKTIEFDENIAYVTKRNRIRQFVQRNMLVFNDTPLLVKVLC